MYSRHDIVPGSNGRSYNTVRCHGCGKMGYYLSHCPEKEQQHLSIDEVTKTNNGNDQDPNHMQIGVMGGDDESESSDESYTIDFSYYQTMMNQSENKNNETDKNSILIDTGSTFSCINNHKLLTDIKKCKPINGISNGGTMVTEYQGGLPGFFTVYYNPESLLNISSFAEVRKKYRITMDTA